MSWVEHFVGLGIACLSYDKRGVGDSEGKFLTGRKLDLPLLASDVVAGVDYLKSRTEIDSSEIGLLGQSQAGWIIPVAASDSRDVSFTVVLSGPTVTLGEEIFFSQLTGDEPNLKDSNRNLSLDVISRRLAETGPSLFDPLPYLMRMTVPGLWLYGEMDGVQPTRESVVILDRLIQDHGKEFTYRVFEGAGHSLSGADGFAETLDGWILDHVTVGDR